MARLSRKQFIHKTILGVGALAGARILSACGGAPPAPATVTTQPATATPQPATTSTTAAKLPTATGGPSDRVIRRPDIIHMYPAVHSKVVHTQHAGAWDGKTLNPAALAQMLDASITKLTGLNDAVQAWASLFAPNERVAIKVNTIDTGLYWTHSPLVEVVADRLQAAGIPAGQIIIYDRTSKELLGAGFQINRDKPGPRCYGTDNDYASGWTIDGSPVRLSNILLSCDALINMPILKSHALSGITFTMKNHYGTFDRPESFHAYGRMVSAISGLNALAPIKDRARLVIGDALTACLREALSWPYWGTATTGNSIYMSFDSVATDAVALQYWSQLLSDDGDNPKAAQERAKRWLAAGKDLGLGTDDANSFELVEQKLS